MAKDDMILQSLDSIQHQINDIRSRIDDLPFNGTASGIQRLRLVLKRNPLRCAVVMSAGVVLVLLALKGASSRRQG
jgi:hypothetical protein